ncbi:PQQ-binding-like beta-propeller repeat protein [Haloarcula rara]|uniref:outer membrane protein assembly factor BamB family protein n=1 Tax=Haloarcula rara TaxID=3033387 RepID=UPI0023E77FE0|nr:PQQ-binding-like beta-propeller repeat protein [Halomicroarcula sp. SHR3]
MFGGKPERNGYLSEESGPDDPTEQWSVKFEPTFYNSPIVADGAIYQTSRDSGTVYGISAEDGSELWTYDIDPGDFPGEPAVADGTVFAGDNVGVVHAIDAADGTELWTHDSGTTSLETSCGVAVVDDTVYVGQSYRGDAKGKLLALNVSNGDVRWEYKDLTGTISAPIVTDGTVYFEDEALLYALNSDDGSEEWVEDFRSFMENDTALLQRPVYHDGALYAGGLKPYDGDGGAAIYAIDASDGSRLWRTEVDTETRQPAVDDDSVYAAGADGRVFSLAQDDGTIEWEVDAGTSKYSPTVADDSLYLGGDFDGFVALDPADGSEQWEYDIDADPGEPVAIVDGTIYASTWRGDIHAIE